MIPLFYAKSGIRYSIRHSEIFANLKDQLLIDLSRVKLYHRGSSRAVKNNDTIVKLIKSMNIELVI